MVGGKKITSVMEVLEKYLDLLIHLFPFKGLGKSNSIRRIASISDVEGKTREVAILDYWSQTVLRGLHQYLFGVLQRIPQDCTFNQGSFKDKVKGFHENGHLYHSVDLTAATDRFPIEAIVRVLKGRFDGNYVNS